MGSGKQEKIRRQDEKASSLIYITYMAFFFFCWLRKRTVATLTVDDSRTVSSQRHSVTFCLSHIAFLSGGKGGSYLFLTMYLTHYQMMGGLPPFQCSNNQFGVISIF